MKAVIFAGGLGTRMREETELRPKPLVEIGGLPVIWHLMKIYAEAGVTEFVVLAGYKASMIKTFFANLPLHVGDVQVDLKDGSVTTLGSHDFDWKVTVLDTGPQALTGERLLLAREHLRDEKFFCTYGDGLAPVNLAKSLSDHSNRGLVATMTVTHPKNRFGVVEVGKDGRVQAFKEKPRMSDLVNMGFFVFEPEIFDFLEPGEALEDGGLVRLAEQGQIGTHLHDGFWEPMDTYREYQLLNSLWEKGEAPWKTWK